ncbi:S-layer homology domain-containing protein [Fervidibacillus halotolerans]|uniref:S-layer homology domain-containing protein n=1 Tax=Fervidibacillus halotolerans TaxID=2980027 RepID=A0A9E8RYE6_9BACI|nr:S-layer homology domain-containing protein [Fervidibacillus halotolerans]WAA12134.1 S-layer homology domain-containing protein [Fervidibacillus halotolerans]
MKKIFLALFTSMVVMPFFANNIYAESDIEGHYFEEEMRLLIEMNILKGYGDGTYKPDEPITRAQFTALVVRLLELPETDEFPSFTDIKKDDWFRVEVATAEKYGLVKGYENGQFHPDYKISRQQMAVIMDRVIQYKEASPGNIELTFADEKEIADWAKSAVQTVVNFGLMNGKLINDELFFAPNDPATRGEVAAVLTRFLRAIGEVDDSPKRVVNVTQYPYDFQTVLSMQADNNPKVDGTGLFTATEELVAYYLNPENFSEDDPEFFQFLKLSYTDGFDGDMINADILPQSEGNPLKGTAEYFLEAAERFQVNPIYLIVHALHETGKGTSDLAKGVPVNDEGEIVEEEEATHIVYNMYGYGAVDSDPLQGGAKYAFEQKWFSPREAIIGGAEIIANSYITKYGQDTLYKMRWNPENPTVHQYATHVEWATSQARELYELFSTYDLVDKAILYFDVPKYINQPASSPLPAPEDRYAVFEVPDGLIGETKVNLKFRTYPWGTVMETLKKGTTVSILGENGGWYKVSVDGKVGWVSGDREYFNIKNALQIQLDSGYLNVRKDPTTNATIVGRLKNNDIVYGVIDENGKFVMDGTKKWYKIHYKINEKWDYAWIYGEFVK